MNLCALCWSGVRTIWAGGTGFMEGLFLLLKCENCEKNNFEPLYFYY